MAVATGKASITPTPLPPAFSPYMILHSSEECRSLRAIRAHWAFHGNAKHHHRCQNHYRKTELLAAQRGILVSELLANELEGALLRRPPRQTAASPLLEGIDMGTQVLN